MPASQPVPPERIRAPITPLPPGFAMDTTAAEAVVGTAESIDNVTAVTPARSFPVLTIEWLIPDLLWVRFARGCAPCLGKRLVKE
jgi:hypothetical protein